MAYSRFTKLSRQFRALPGRGSRSSRDSPQAEIRESTGVPRFMQAASESMNNASTRSGRYGDRQPGGGEFKDKKAGASPMPFPHSQKIRSQINGISYHPRAVHDPLQCSLYGVPAFTDGLVSHFSTTNPPLNVAAHEAGHQLQHAGLTNDGGHGPELHASLFAASIEAQRSAHHVVSSAGSPVASAMRPYTEFSVAEQNSSNQWKVGSAAKVGDKGQTVTTEYKHECYAEPKLIQESNLILKAKGSGVNIEPGSSGPSGFAPDGSGFRSLVKVNYNILSDEDNEKFYADCGVSAREVMGKMGTDTKAKAIFKDTGGLRQETAASYNPATFRDEIYMRGGLGASPSSAHAAYNALSTTEQDAFDKKHGINQYAAPGVGEAYTRARDYSRVGSTGFNWHWGGVIMVAGGDRVTFENYTKDREYLAKDSDWYFATYGPPSKPGQTWHEQWVSVGGSGKGATLAAATSADPSPFTNAATTMTTAELIARYNASSNAGEKMALESELKGRWIKVTVLIKKAQEGTDEVYAEAAHRGRTSRTGAIDIQTGQKNTFWISLSNLFPINGEIMIKVYDEDLISDDMISIIGFDSPYTPQSDNRPWDDAEYHTKVEFDR